MNGLKFLLLVCYCKYSTSLIAKNVCMFIRHSFFKLLNSTMCRDSVCVHICGVRHNDREVFSYIQVLRPDFFRVS